jgi:hypothetical protein
MNRILRNAIISSIVSVVATWITEFPFTWHRFLLVPTCDNCPEPSVFYPTHFLLDFLFWFVIFFAALTVATINEKEDKRTMRVVRSLGLSLGAGAVVVLGSAYTLELVFGNADDLLAAIPACAILSATLYAIFSARTFKFSSVNLTDKLVRNAGIALLSGLLFTIITSGYYSYHLMNSIVTLWFCVSFVVVCVFDYTWRKGNAQPPKTSTIKTA